MSNDARRKQWMELIGVGLQYLAATGVLDKLAEFKRQVQVVNRHLADAAVEIGAAKREDLPENIGFMPLLTLILSHWANMASGAKSGRMQ